MTTEQAIRNLQDIKSMYTWSSGADEALDLAIEALITVNSPSLTLKRLGEFCTEVMAKSLVNYYCIHYGNECRTYDCTGIL